jgi:hypothetical protein
LASCPIFKCPKNGSNQKEKKKVSIAYIILRLFMEKWKMTSIVWKMRDNLNMLANGRKTTSICWQMEDNQNNLANGRRSQNIEKWKRTPILKIEDNINFGKRKAPYFFGKQKMTSIFGKWKKKSILLNS